MRLRFSTSSRRNMIYFAHSANGIGQWHPLADHLRSVGDLAAAHAANALWADEAQLAGLLHDLGKYGDRFQERPSREGKRAYSGAVYN